MIDQGFYQSVIGEIPKEQVEAVHLFHHTVLIKTALGVGVSSITGGGICPPPRDFGQLHYKNLNELAHYYDSDNYLEIAIGMAAINCHLNRNLSKAHMDYNAHQFLSDYGRGKSVAIIGGFPFIERLKDDFEVKDLWVFELKPRHGYELSVDKYQDYLPQADLVLITASTFVNKTFDTIYPHLNNSFNVLMGPTTPMSAKLFDYKIDALSGMIVEDYQKAFLSFSQGAASKYAQGVKKLTLLKKDV